MPSMKKRANSVPQPPPRKPEAGGTAPAVCHATALRKATRRLSQLYDAALAPCGLRSTQRSILRHIDTAGNLTMGELADLLILDRSALNHNLKPLERDGLVQVRVAPEDKRSRRVTLTPAGREKLSASQSLWLAAQRRFEAIIPADQTAALSTILAVISSLEFAQTFIASPEAHRAKSASLKISDR